MKMTNGHPEPEGRRILSQIITIFLFSPLFVFGNEFRTIGEMMDEIQTLEKQEETSLEDALLQRKTLETLGADKIHRRLDLEQEARSLEYKAASYRNRIEELEDLVEQIQEKSIRILRETVIRIEIEKYKENIPEEEFIKDQTAIERYLESIEDDEFKDFSQNRMDLENRFNAPSLETFSGRREVLYRSLIAGATLALEVGRFRPLRFWKKNLKRIKKEAEKSREALKASLWNEKD